MHLDHSSKDRLVKHVTEPTVHYTTDSSSNLSAGGSPKRGPVVRPGRLHKDPVIKLANNPKVYYSADTSSDEAPVTSPVQTVSLGTTTTNFTNQPLSPVLNLFDPSLGTLTVRDGESLARQSRATSRRRTSARRRRPSITATFTGSYQIDGLNQPISQPPQTLRVSPCRRGRSGQARIRSCSRPSCCTTRRRQPSPILPAWRFSQLVRASRRPPLR